MERPKTVDRYNEPYMPEHDQKQIRSVAVIGAGYVGLPLCLHLARAGFRVTAVDVDERAVQQINQRVWKTGEEKEFEIFFQDREVQANLRAQTTPVEADAFFIAVPTPVHHDTKRADLDAVVAATESITSFVKPGNLVVIESTIPPYTTEKIVKPIIERSGYLVPEDISLAHCPERILPGNIMHEFIHNARIVGGVGPRATERAAALYAHFIKGRIYRTSARAAELAKLVENSYRDVNIAFANQIAVLSEELGLDPEEVIELANQHPRVKILSPGIGVGGHCIPIDPWFLVDAFPDETALIKSARELNDSMPARTAGKILKAVSGLKHPKIVLLGATYKPNVKDVRESPALEVFECLKKRGADVALYDPLLPEYICDSILSVARGADAVAILVPHDLLVAELRVRKQEILAAMRHPNLIALSSGVL